MSEKPITPLRQRMIEDMSVRRFTPATQRQYIRAVKRLAAFLGRIPDTATPEELRSFQPHLTGTGVQPTSINTTVTALRWRPAYQNKAVVYDLLFKASSEAMLTIAADPKHLGARIGITSVLHSWGSVMTHHPHVHMIVPGGGLDLDGSRWVSCKPDFFLPVLVLSKLFRRLMLEKLMAAHQAGRLQFLGSLAYLADAKAGSPAGAKRARL